MSQSGPNTLCIFAKDDSKVGFHSRTCTREGLFNAVHLSMFGHALSTAEMREETQQIVDALIAEGHISFEDGWIELRTGIDDIVSFFTAKIEEARAEEAYADAERFKELTARRACETEYALVCEALIRALGPSGIADVRAALDGVQ